MTYQGDPNHPLGGPPHRYAQNERSRKMVWGTFAVLAILVLAGFMFYNSGGHGPQTASNNSSAVTQPTPVPGPTTPAPAPPPQQ